MAVCVCVCVLNLLHAGYQNTHSTSKGRSFLEVSFKGLMRVKTWFKGWVGAGLGLGRRSGG